MMDLIKALLLGAALVAGILLIPVIMAVLGPIILFAIVVLIIWFILKVLDHDEPPEDPPP